MGGGVIKRLFGRGNVIVCLFLLLGCSSVEELSNEPFVSEYMENISDTGAYVQENVIESEITEKQEESDISENNLYDGMDASVLMEVEDSEAIKQKALVAYQEYIDSDEMLEYATPIGEPGRRYLTEYLIWDVNGDGIPELHLNNGREYFIYTYSVEEDKAVWWKTFYPNLHLRQDNILIYQWSDSTPAGWEIVFNCFSIDQNGEEIEIAYIRMCDTNNDGKYDETDSYALDAQSDCSFAEWKMVAEQYLEFNAEGIIIEKALQYLNLVEWTIYCEAK